MQTVDKKRSTFKGKKLTVTVFGASHDSEIGVIVKGYEKSPINLDELQRFLDRRKPNSSAYSTPRKESDNAIILSGVKNEKLTGKKFKAIIKNENFKSADYGDGVVTPRPSHADYVAVMKYGNTFDYRGGGKFSGRLTAPMCIAGGICKQLLKAKGITVNAFVKNIGSVQAKGYNDIDASTFDFSVAETDMPLIDESKKQELLLETENARSQGDSVGGSVEVVVKGLPVGTGEYMFDSLEGALSRLIFAVPATKGIEFGLGFGFSTARGSNANDAFYYDNGVVKTKTNNNGGINGGLANGMPITFRVAVKPTPSIALEQQTVNLKTGENTTLTVGGRHDASIVFRAATAIEAVTAIAIYDNME